jgi:hypothetical protein
MNRLFTILLGASLVGCAGVASNPNESVLISENLRPDWVDEYELEDSTHLFFTGISTKYAEERKALKDAKYDALAKFLDYCGLHTKLHEKYISQVHGSTANVLSATNKIETQLEINSEALVGQFRIVKKYLEVYSGTRGKFYKVYVFASVPKIEVARVKTWQKENDIQKISKLRLLNNQQSQIIIQTKEELNGVQQQLEQLTFLRNRVTNLSSENNKLITENKQLKETFHKDIEIKEALTATVNELSINGINDDKTIEELTEEVILLKVDNSKVTSLTWERDKWHEMYLEASNKRPMAVQAIIKWLAD